MNCSVAQENLVRLHDHELRGLAALALKRHLKHCPTCQQEWHALTQLDSLLHQADLAPVPAPPTVSVLRPLGYAGGLALAAGMALVFLRPSPSFAQVEKALAEIRTATWKVTIESREAQHRNTTSGTCWADLEHAQVMTLRQGQAPTYSLFDGTKELFYFPNIKTYYLTSAHPDSQYNGTTPEEKVRHTVLFDQEAPRPDASAKGGRVTFHDALSPWTSRAETLDGKETLRFERHGTRQLLFTNPKEAPIQRGLAEVVWVEPKTLLVVRRESTLAQGSRYTKTICSDFRFNQTPPANTFTIPKPKVGETYSFLDFTDETEALLASPVLAEDKQAMLAVVRRAIAAWDRKDATAFLKEFDFPKLAAWQITERQAEWRKRIQRGDAYQSWGQPTEATVFYVLPPREYTRRSEQDPFPPQTDPRRYAHMVVIAPARLTKAPSTRQPLTTTFNFSKRTGTWRLSWFNQWTRPKQWGPKK